MKPLLALDLGTRCGWCLRHGNDTYAGGTQDFSGPKDRVGQRYLYLQRFLIRVRDECHDYPLAVVYEKVQFMPKRGGLLAAQAWAGFEAVVTMWCEGKSIPYVAVPAGTLKKDWTGNGHASKEDMVNHARKLGWVPVDDNHADAIALLAYYEVHHEQRPRRVPGYEKSTAPADLALEA